MQEIEEFETDDIYLSSYLKISGCTMERRRRLGNKVIFIFTNIGGSIKDLREAYYMGKARVDPHAFATATVSMKKLCFET